MKILDSQSFFVNTPLYQTFAYEDDEVFDVANLVYFRGTIDSYCVECKRDSTFKGIAELPAQFSPILRQEYEKNKEQAKKAKTDLDRAGSDMAKALAFTTLQQATTKLKNLLPIIEQRAYLIPLFCTRDSNHLQWFIVLVKGKTFQKIGQYPSIGDLKIPGVKKYAPLLGSVRFRELSRSIGLASHDVGIGAFVYLRRIFESLIVEAHEEAAKTDGWAEERYEKSRMEDKIKLLKNWLPDLLVKNAKLHSLLSKGIHELSEEECLKYFNTVKVVIELILDEKLEKREREKKVEEAQKSLGQAIDEISNR